MAKKPNNPPVKPNNLPEKTSNLPLIKAVKDEDTAISSSSSQRETNIADLPLDIIISIIDRLPMKSLFQFNFVCKSWRALLSTREIAIRINKVSDKKFTLMRNIDVWDIRYEVIGRFKIPIELKSLEFMLLEPVNGILCICGPILSHITSVYLWNPLTREFKALPKPVVHMGYVAIGFGFGFVPNTNDFKVVRVLQHERKFEWRVEIYSLNRDSWRTVWDSSDEISETERGTFWKRRSHACEDRFRGGALPVDLENEVIAETDFRKHCRTITWDDKRDAIFLVLPEDDLVLCKHSGCSRSSTIFDFAGSLVSLNRDHNNLG